MNIPKSFYFNLSTFIMLLAAGTQSVFSANLQRGECLAIPDSKVYLTNNFTSPYPKKVEFTCLYQCLGTDDPSIQEIQGSHQITVRNQNDDAIKVVCQGVKLKRTSWGHDFDQVKPFYAFRTSVPEIRDWAQVHVSRSNPHEKKLLTELKENLNEIYDGYAHPANSNAPTASSFKLARSFIKKISTPLPDDTTKLERAIETLKEKEELISGDPMANQLVQGILNSQADWLF